MSKLLEYVTISKNKKRELFVHVIIILRHKIFSCISTRSFLLEIRFCIFLLHQSLIIFVFFPFFGVFQIFISVV
jgi:hypothetical protein